ncbi:hypothetical protein [Lysinibacillus xylanilyticus]|uniref:hypothetical protein n=1 Tax=Lysinibacillus xylanilyticus TaxID=582475 RepID=UPI003D05D75A
MGITINQKPTPPKGGTGEDTQLRADFKSHKDTVGLHLREGDTKKIDSIATIDKSVVDLNKTVNDLKLSVSDKNLKIASAITDRGVPTNADATGDVMAANIRAIPSGGSKPFKGTFTALTGGSTIPDIPFHPRLINITYDGQYYKSYCLGIRETPTDTTFKFADTSGTPSVIPMTIVENLNGTGKWGVYLHNVTSFSIPITYEIIE